ncbi:hypothetical protein, partial [Methylobacterium sp. B1]|uniref:hypothetical protein n=1 Tax=Methylobacterium sp. B1 TaxID=91459 RepID=UPI001AEC0BE1
YSVILIDPISGTVSSKFSTACDTSHDFSELFEHSVRLPCAHEIQRSSAAMELQKTIGERLNAHSQFERSVAQSNFVT